MTTDQPPPQDEAVLRLLQERAGLATEIVLSDGQRLTVFNIAWGYEPWEEHAHVTTNISPGIACAAIDFFSTQAVVAIIDPANGAVLLGAS
ncbi:hypothetical protein SAMN05443665_1025107 [Actinomadura meyerae]|uniref:Uncharacterized protein n=1 Tax=Actinomadura meyerae TaxID=240840 RepID=A0A239M2B0_9ACTN|nr:hypothetical protein [Actinomadura meyerae]SNT36907.1 hypothetical protein SAMN05443665_1025107 [Actinomadura meyerae]